MSAPFDLQSIIFKAAPTLSLIELPPTKWKLMPGRRLELNSTGFAILMNSDPKRFTYDLIDPEGRTLLGGPDLQSIKVLAEKWADDRKEFEL